MINGLGTALSGLIAASTRLSASAQNISNIQVTGSLDSSSGNQAYQAVTTKFETQDDGQGVTGTVVPKAKPTVAILSPSDPNANEDGFVAAPNVNLAEEAVNLKIGEYAYRANLSVISTISEMSDELLNIFDDD
jgi:flagellar basal-body rod protein FlgC